MGEIFCKLGYGAGAVADGVLDVVAQFGKGLVVAFGLENGVVAEAFASPALVYDGAVDNAFIYRGER